MRTPLHSESAASRRSRSCLHAAGAVMLLAAAGCQAPRPRHGTQPIGLETPAPPPMRPAYRRLLEEGARNSVLNRLEIGVDAYQLGYRKLAAESLDRALDRIESTYGRDPNARRAMSLWHEESAKTFKGEPYERGMAYYYRGLLFLREGDLENARACFRAGQFEIRAGMPHPPPPPPFLRWLELWCTRRLEGDPAPHRAHRENADLETAGLTPPEASRNLLLVLESGGAPRKRATGPGGSILEYAPGDAGPVRVEPHLPDGTEGTASHACDVYRLASARARRPAEEILENKVRVRDRYENAGDILTRGGVSVAAAGASIGGREGEIAAIAGGAATLTGLVSRSVARAVRPEADTRSFRNLPGHVYVAAFRAEPGTARIVAVFKDGRGDRTDRRSIEVTVPASGRASAMAWERRSRSLAAGRPRGTRRDLSAAKTAGKRRR